MTHQQRIAIEHPCRLAVETMHPRFRDRNGITTTGNVLNRTNEAAS